MNLNFIKIAIRNMLKDRAYAFINIIGLSLGVAFSFLIFLYVLNETSYDKHISGSENVYRLAADFTIDDHEDIYSNVPRPMGQALVREYPGITSSVRVVGYNGLQVHEGYLWNEDADYINSKNAFVVDSTFFEVFRLPLIAGDSATALDHPNNIVISQSVAKALFGNENALGKRIKLEENNEAIVTGIFADYEKPTYLPFDVLISYRTYIDAASEFDYWYGAHVYTYVRTVPSFKPSDVYNNWQPFFDKYMKETFTQLEGTAEIIFQPLESLHLAPEYIWEPYPHSSKQNVYVFLIVGFFLLLVAGFNYMNLALSRSLSRSHEVGVRKALGANRWMISFQFIIESLVTALIATAIAIILAKAILPTFNLLIGEKLKINFIENPILLVGFIGIGLSVGILSGLYPALHISGLQVVRVLKGSGDNKKSGSLSIRKGLVALQQVISLSLIICTLVVVDQVNYVRHMDLGFDKDNLVVIDLRDSVIRQGIKKFEQDLYNIPGVENVTRMNDIPLTGINEYTYVVEKANGAFESVPSQIIDVGENFLKTMDIELIAGRTFVESDGDYRSVLINEYEAKYLGYDDPHEAVGARFKFPGEEGEQERKIIGVVKNFRMVAASEALKSLTIAYSSGGRRFMGIRINPKNQAQVLTDIAQSWKNFGATYPFYYTFMDDQLDSLLGKEDRLYKLMVFGSFLIIIVSCMGLFGLISYTALQRTKEIGIRKVLGASKGELFYALAKDFLILLAIAFIISVGVSWYFGSEWLQNFAFRTHFNWFNVVWAAIAGMLITLLTLGYHAQKVILTNPVESLKEE